MSGFSSEKKIPESFINSISQKFVYIKAETFMMGSNSGGLDPNTLIHNRILLYTTLTNKKI